MKKLWLRNFLYTIGKPFYSILAIIVFEILPDLTRLLALLGRAIISQPPPSPIVQLPRISKRGKRIISRAIFFFPIIASLLGLVIASLFWVLILRDLPHPEDLVRKPRPLTTKINDRNGNLLFKIFRNQNRTYIPLTEIPQSVQEATIAIEDAEFYSHPGFSVRGIARAVERNVIRGQMTGGSTITQQLIKNALLTPERTFRRKIKEVILALWTELTFSKDKILEMYLNEVSYGGTAYGIEEASLLYFGKSARELTLAESALLAGLPGAPTHFSPFGANPELALGRQQVVLVRMAEEGYITPEQKREAQGEEVIYTPQKREIKAPHFVQWAKQVLVEKYGERLVEEGGLEVTTSLDLPTQEKVEKILTTEVQKLGRLNVSNGAVLVTNPGTGEVISMVGSQNYFNPKSGNFNVTTALRQPGSSIKPINYAYALSHGYSPSSLLDDMPVTYRGDLGAPAYTPRNYDGRFRGKVTLRTSLGSSLNVPAVRVLASYGVDKMIELGKRMGIASWNGPKHFGLSLTLGSGEIRMTELAVAYGALANYGGQVDLDPILQVKDHTGKVLEGGACGWAVVNFQDPSRAGKLGNCVKEVLDPRVAFMITDIMSDNKARIPVFGGNSLLVIPNHPEVAVKTGTSQALRDNWAIGYTKEYLVAAWVGNNNNTPMSKIASGITGATPIWANIMKLLLADAPTPDKQYWQPPAGVVKLSICPATNTLTCGGCGGYEDWFLEENQPTKHCTIQPSPTPAPSQ